MALRVGLGPGQLEAVTILLLIGLLQSGIRKYGSSGGRVGEGAPVRAVWSPCRTQPHPEFANLRVPTVSPLLLLVP